MDDRHRACVPFPHVVRTGEFSRLGKSVIAFAYERVMPISRAMIPIHTSFPDARRDSVHSRHRARKAGA
jgi:hypothetical protein